MALQTSILTEFGVYATYWTIGAVFQDFRARSTDVVLIGHADGEARRRGNAPMAIKKVTLSGELYREDEGSRWGLYRVLRELPEFSTAADV